MRKLFTLIIISVFGAGVINAQLQPIITGHESFETWVSAAAGEDPEYFTSTNSQLGFGQTLVNITEGTTDSQDGSSHAILTTTEVLGYTVPGVLTQGRLVFNLATLTGDISGGAPYTTRSAQMKGYFKYAPVNNDTAAIAVWLLKGSTPDTVAVGGITIIGTTDTWTEFTIDLTYLSGETPDTLNFLFASSAIIDNAQAGSVLEIDNVWFEGVVTSVNNVVANSNFIISPNPANGYFNLKMDNSVNTTVKVHNTVGQVVISKTFNKSSLNETFDISNLNKGIYFVEVINDGKSNIKKLVIR